MKVKLWWEQFRCQHWWKAISKVFVSPYFIADGTAPGYSVWEEYQTSQCKMCGKLKTDTVGPVGI